MQQLSEQVALITGAGREPARSLALALAARGVGLALSDLTPMALEQTAAQAQSLGARVTTHVTDASKGLAARMLVDEVLETWDGLDILVLHPYAEPRHPLLQLDEWDFQHTFESNINGPFLLMQLAANWMHSEARSGVIINLISAGPTPPQARKKQPFTPARWPCARSPRPPRLNSQRMACACSASPVRLKPGSARQGRRAGCQVVRVRPGCSAWDYFRIH